jgi:capsular polysaccharide biosynthesis protein
MTTPATTHVRIGDIIRWWPLIVVTTLLAVAAGTWSSIARDPTYTATTKLLVVPLVQWDETFLGTSLVRDSGDATRTAATMAVRLNGRHAAELAAAYLGGRWTPESVDATVEASTAQETNVIEVRARSTDRARATQVVDGFVHAWLADRWRAISAELDARIAAVSHTKEDVAKPGDAEARLQTLNVIRNEGSDPTVKVDSTTPAVRDKRMPVGVVAALAAAGGLLLGVLAAAGLVRLPRRRGEGTPHVHASVDRGGAT